MFIKVMPFRSQWTNHKTNESAGKSNARFGLSQSYKYIARSFLKLSNKRVYMSDMRAKISVQRSVYTVHTLTNVWVRWFLDDNHRVHNNSYTLSIHFYLSYLNKRFIKTKSARNRMHFGWNIKPTLKWNTLRWTREKKNTPSQAATATPPPKTTIYRE